MTIIASATKKAGNDFFSNLKDAIVFFHKKLCPHCKNMEKVLIKFGSKFPDVELFSVDSEARPELMEQLGFERVPTMVFIRDGSVVKVQSGIMNPRELKVLYASL